MSGRPDRTQQVAYLRCAAELGGLAVEEYVLPEDSYVVVGAQRLHYLDWAAEEGARNVLFLHGGGLTAHTWDLVCLGLRPRYRCLALDLRGHGDSDWSPTLDYSRNAHVADLEGFVDLLALERFVLVGMSLGGLNALEYATRHAKRLQGLVIVDVSPEIQATGARRIGAFLDGEVEFASVEEAVEQALSFNQRRRPELLRVSLLHNLRQLPNGNWTWKYDRRPRLTAGSPRANRAVGPLIGRIPAISCPTLVVRGAESDILTAEAAERLVRDLPDGRWTTIDQAGHTIQGDNPSALIRALDTFLNEVES